MKTEPLTHQQMVNELEDLLRRAKERSCRPCRGTGNLVLSVGDAEIDMGARCRNCHGTGTITDPDLQEAWELLGGRNKGEVAPAITVYGIDWWPDGAVRGLLEQVVETLWRDDAFVEALNRTAEVVTMFTSGVEYPFRWPSSNVQSLGKAIKEALNEQH